MALRWQVLSRALEALGLAFVPVDSPDAAGVAEAPAREDAFMCNMQVHAHAVPFANRSAVTCNRIALSQLCCAKAARACTTTTGSRVMAPR
jgi:hypothetical protein